MLYDYLHDNWGLFCEHIPYPMPDIFEILFEILCNYLCDKWSPLCEHILEIQSFDYLCDKWGPFFEHIPYPM